MNNKMMLAAIGEKLITLAFTMLANHISSPELTMPEYLKNPEYLSFEKKNSASAKTTAEYLEKARKLLEKAQIEEKCKVCKDKIDIALEEIEKTNASFNLMKKKGYKKWGDIPKEMREEILKEAIEYVRGKRS